MRLRRHAMSTAPPTNRGAQESGEVTEAAAAWSSAAGPAGRCQDEAARLAPGRRSGRPGVPSWRASRRRHRRAEVGGALLFKGGEDGSGGRYLRPAPLGGNDDLASAVPGVGPPLHVSELFEFVDQPSNGLLAAPGPGSQVGRSDALPEIGQHGPVPRLHVGMPARGQLGEQGPAIRAMVPSVGRATVTGLFRQIHWLPSIAASWASTSSVGTSRRCWSKAQR
jgi:hypothetical protein